LYVIFGALEGEIGFLPVYAVLVGLFYHIHIALLPILPLPILAYLLSKGTMRAKLQKVKLKQIFISLVIFLALSSPFWVFEIKHNFSQVKAIVAAMNTVYVGPTGIRKLEKIIDASGREWQQRWLNGVDGVNPIYFWEINIIVVIGLVIKRRLKNGQLILTGLWISLIMLAQFTSKRVISEYYFTNLVPIYFLLIALFVEEFFRKNIILVPAILIYGAMNFMWMFKNANNTESYYERAKLVDYIKTDAKVKNFPCIGINYIADFGKGVGFRYLFWYKGVNIIKPGSGMPVYNIVIPLQISENEIDESFGRFGVILPKNNTIPNESACNSEKNQLDPLLGYTE
jgi:hypothetical protein